MTDISIKPYSLTIGKTKLLIDTELIISAGTRYGVVGYNGCGKTTLLHDIVESGFIDEDNILLVAQEIKASNQTVEEAVISANQILSKILVQESDGCCDIDYHGINPDKEKAMVRKILYGLGFDDDDRDKPTSAFSGGWRMRIAIARALYIKPRFLLLDEPTNHLDQTSVIWLTDYLSKWENTLLVISHDSYFLNEVCNTIIHIYHQKLNYHRAKGKDVFFKFRRALERNLIREHDEWSKWQKSVSKKGKSGKTLEEIEKERLKKGIENPGALYQPKLVFEDTSEVRGTIINCCDVTFSYPGTNDNVLSNVDFALDLNTRMVIVGRNGSGKSTLLKLLSGQLKLAEGDSGSIDVNPRLRIGVFHQHFADILDYDVNPVDFITAQYHDIEPQQVRRHLGTFGLEGSQHLVKIGDLSGGQKARVALVNMIFMKPHFLILDEPTNHLDLETIEALIEAINKYNGGLVLVTHNADLIIETKCRLYECSGGSISPFRGDYYDYCDQLLEELELEGSL